MRSFAVILFGFVLLAMQAALGTQLPMHPYVPNPVLPMAVYLGVSPDVSPVRGASICFALGYLLDLGCGSSVGLQTFVLVAAFFVARGAGVRFAPQGLSFQLLMNFVMAIATGGTLVALRAIFDHAPPFPTADAERHSLLLLKSASVTALLGPFVFAGMRRIDLWLSQQRGDERAAQG